MAGSYTRNQLICASNIDEEISDSAICASRNINWSTAVQLNHKTETTIQGHAQAFEGVDFTDNYLLPCSSLSAPCDGESFSKPGDLHHQKDFSGIELNGSMDSSSRCGSFALNLREPVDYVDGMKCDDGDIPSPLDHPAKHPSSPAASESPRVTVAMDADDAVGGSSRETCRSDHHKTLSPGKNRHRPRIGEPALRSEILKN